jgi:hypothetical protein
MNTNLKCLMAAAFIVVFGTPALAANHVEQRHVRASQAPYAATQHTVIAPDGQAIGADPDPSIRSELERDWNAYAQHWGIKITSKPGDSDLRGGNAWSPSRSQCGGGNLVAAKGPRWRSSAPSWPSGDTLHLCQRRTGFGDKVREQSERGVRSGEVSMRLPILWLFLIAVVPLGKIQAVSAQSPTSYPWCARFFNGAVPGTTSCYFGSYERCLTTLSGIGGYCYRSPYYHAAPITAPPVNQNSGPAHPRRHRHTWRRLPAARPKVEAASGAAVRTALQAGGIGKRKIATNSGVGRARSSQREMVARALRPQPWSVVG